jgi:hypothetical protein
MASKMVTDTTATDIVIVFTWGLSQTKSKVTKSLNKKSKI